MRSDKVSRSQSCWSTIESISSNKSFWSQEVFDRSGSQRALTRAPDRKKFLIDRRSIGESMSSNKSSWSPEFLIDWGLNVESSRSQNMCCSMKDQMSSDSNLLTQDVCWSIGKSTSSDKSSRSQEIYWSIGVAKHWYEVPYILVLPM